MKTDTSSHHDRMVLLGVGEAWLAMLCWSGLLGGLLVSLRSLWRRLHA